MTLTRLVPESPSCRFLPPAPQFDSHYTRTELRALDRQRQMDQIIVQVLQYRALLKHPKPNYSSTGLMISRQQAALPWKLSCTWTGPD